MERNSLTLADLESDSLSSTLGACSRVLRPVAIYKGGVIPCCIFSVIDGPPLRPSLEQDPRHTLSLAAQLSP